MRSRQARRSFLKTSVAAGAASWISLPEPARAATFNATSRVKVTEVRSYKLKDALLVQVVADNGASGWGEASANNRHVIETLIHTGLKEQLIGRNVWDAEPLWDDLFLAQREDGALICAIASIDLALWDLRGKLAGQPVYRLLGGGYRHQMRAYGSFGLGLGSQTPLTIDDAARAAAKLVERGFTALKPRTQFHARQINPHPDPTFAYLKAIRRAIGDRIELFVCLDSGYTAARAIELGKRLHGELGINYLEEAVSTHNLHELAQVCEALPFPVSAGENAQHRWQVRDLIDTGKVGLLNPDIVKCGGLTEAKKIAALAQACSKPIAPRNPRPLLGAAATLHFLASISNAGPFVEFPETEQFRELLGMLKTNVKFKRGYLSVPQQPGLGLEVDGAAVRRMVIK